MLHEYELRLEMAHPWIGQYQPGDVGGGGVLPPPPPPGDDPQPGQLYPGQIVQQYPDGTAMIFTGQYDGYGDPVYDFIDISAPAVGGGGAANPPTTTGGVRTENIPGVGLVLIQDTNYGPQVLQVIEPDAGGTVYGGTPPAGYTFAYNNQGQPIQLVNDPSYQQPTPNVGALQPGPNGLYYTTDPGGGYTGYIGDPSYQPTYGAPTSVGSGLLGVPGQGGGGYTSFINDPTYRPTFGENTVDLGNGYIGFTGPDGEIVDITQDPNYVSDYTKGIDDRNFGEDVRRFNATLAEDTASRQEHNAFLYAQLAATTGVERERIAAQIQMNNAQIADNERQRQSTERIAGFQGGVQQRGQDIDYGLTTRGQDIQREGLVTGAIGDYYATAGALSDDPFRQAQLLVGGSGGTTPNELAANDYRAHIARLSRSYSPVGAAAPLPGTISLGAKRGLTVHPEMIEMGNGKQVRMRPGQAANVAVHDGEMLRTRMTPRGMMLEEVVPRDRAQGMRARFGAAFGLVNAAAGVSAGNADAEYYATSMDPAGQYVWSDGTRHNGPERPGNTGPDTLPAPNTGSDGFSQPMLPSQPARPTRGIGPNGEHVIVNPDGSMVLASDGVTPVSPRPTRPAGPQQGFETGLSGVNYYNPSNSSAGLTMPAEADPLATYSPAQLAAAAITRTGPGTYNLRNRASGMSFRIDSPLMWDEAMRRLRGVTPDGNPDAAPPADTGTPVDDGTPSTPPASQIGGDDLGLVDLGLVTPGVSSAADVEAARQYVRDTLSGITTGASVGAGATAWDLNLDPVYDVNIGNPQDYAGNFYDMERPQQDVLASAFKLRGIEPDVFERRLRKFRPAALQPGMIVSYS